MKNYEKEISQFEKQIGHRYNRKGFDASLRKGPLNYFANIVDLFYP